MANCGKLLDRWEYKTVLTVSWETCMWVKKHQLEPYMEQVIGSKLRKYNRAVGHHTCLFNLHIEHIMRHAGLDELQAGIKIGGRNINNLRYVDDITLMAESKEELKSLLMRVEEESETASLRLNIKIQNKTKIMAFGPITAWQIKG